MWQNKRTYLRRATNLVSETWREISLVMNCFARYGFSNFVGPQTRIVFRSK